MNIVLRIINLAVAFVDAALVLRVTGKAIKAAYEARPSMKDKFKSPSIAEMPLEKLLQCNLLIFLSFLVLKIPVLNLLTLIGLYKYEDKAADAITVNMIKRFDKISDDTSES